MKRFKRNINLTILITVSILLSGCVYLRLLETKGQLASFEKHFDVVESKELVSIEFRNPTLKEKDLTLLDLFYSEKQINEDKTRWKVVLEKRFPAGTSQSEAHDLIAWLEFTNDKLTSIEFEPKYFDVFPIPFVIETGIALGKSKINLIKQTVTGKWRKNPSSSEDPLKDISAERLQELFGPPYTKETNDEANILTYRYLNRLPLSAEEQKSKKYVIRYHIDKQSQRLSALATDSIRIDFLSHP